MKLLILSDSHGAVDTMYQIVREEKPDAIIHLGDLWDDVKDLESMVRQIPIYHVGGNCDSFRHSPGIREQLTPVLGGVRFFLTHGHRQNVKMHLYGLLMAAMEADARVALFGHTHEAHAEEANGVLLLNPGTCKGYYGTYAVMEVANGNVTYEFRKTRKD